MLTIIYFFLGASLGSFIGLICDRFPEKSIIFPSSHCSHCKHQLRFFEMIPILSQLFLRSRCRSCQTSIPLRYLFMELFCGVICLSASDLDSWNTPAPIHGKPLSHFYLRTHISNYILY